MNRKNYVFVNTGLNIFNIKMSNNLDLSLQEARDGVLQSETNTILYNDFFPKDDNDSSAIYASYFHQTTGTEGTFSIYKKTPFQKYYTYVCELANSYEFIDYNVTNNSHYHYLVAYRFNKDKSYKIYQNVLNGNPTYVDTKWDNWSICNIKETDDENIYYKTGDTWFLRYNLSAGDITLNNSITTWDTLGQFPKFSVGKKNYQGSNVSCLLGDIVKHQHRTVKQTQNDVDIPIETVQQICGYTEKRNITNGYAKETEKYESWKKFITDGELKLLKDYKGNAWIVQVMANPTANIDTKSNLQQTVISFSWQEVLDVNSVSIVSESDL